jgi:hypothetical protein
MRRYSQGLAALTVFIVAYLLMVTTPAFAISAELANKCRQMAIKAHPPKQPGGKKGYAKAERDFFNSCVSKNSAMPGNNNQKSTK